MQGIGSPSTKNLHRKFLSCHSDQKSVLTIRLGLFFYFRKIKTIVRKLPKNVIYFLIRHIKHIILQIT